MSSHESHLRHANDCDCCAGTSAQTPARVRNRPGLTEIDYRVGTYSEFKATMLARLSSRDLTALQALKSRDDDDFVIALLDAWAMVGDVLTFYQERIANESYLLTARERMSLLELSRLIGYRLAPGVAASAHLAFTMDEAPGAPEKETKSTIIDVGTMVQSTPGPGEEAQTFETIESITARVDWNRMHPQSHVAHPVTAEMGQMVLAGAVSNVRRGDVIALVEQGTVLQLRRVAHIDSDIDAATTTVHFVGDTASPIADAPSLPTSTPEDVPLKTPLDDTVVEQIMGARWSSEDLCALAEIQGWDLTALRSALDAHASRRDDSADTGVFVFRRRAALFGHNALKMVTYNTIGQPNPQSSWSEWSPDADEDNDRAFLDAEYGDIVPGDFVALQLPATALTQDSVYKVADVVTAPRSAYGLSGKSTRLTLSGDWWTPGFDSIRGTTAFVQSEKLSLSELPVTTPVEGDTVVLEAAFPELKKGQHVWLHGERADLRGTNASEIRTLHEVWIEAGLTVLVLDQALDHAYVRGTVEINGNIAVATHGETVHEVLGSGNAAHAYQGFVLKQPPLTYVSADSPSGTRSTLEVRVNNVLTTEVPHLLEQGPDDHVYVTKRDDPGRTAVQFGNGVHGAHLPSGQDNVRASYRRGIGLGGLLEANQLDVLMSQPLGVRAVTNPRASSGAQDPESREDARRNAPFTVMTLDRAVSLRDYEDMARAFAGVGKAQSIWVWSENQKQIFVTVAGPRGEAVDPASPTYKNLLAALRTYGDPFVEIRVATYLPAFFRLDAALTVEPALESEAVLETVRDNLRTAFGFETREFGQPVQMSEVIAAIQSVDGVIAVDLNHLHRSDAASPPTLEPRLPAARAVRGSEGEMLAAELLTLDPAPLDKLKVQS